MSCPRNRLTIKAADGQAISETGHSSAMPGPSSRRDRDGEPRASSSGRLRGRPARVLAAALLVLALPGSGARADAPPPGARDFSIARLKYGGGGDWYEDRTSMVNLLRALRERTSIPVAGDKEA